MAQSTQSMPMQTPLDLFVHELSDTYDAEQQLTSILGEAQNLAQNEQLRQGIQHHLQETQQQIQNLDQIFQQLGQERHPVRCHAVSGLYQSLQDVLQSNPSPQVLEGALVAGLLKSEHLEVAGYSGLVTKAQAMGQQEIVNLLQQNLDQELAQFEKLTQIGQQLSQQMAQQM